MRFHASLMIGQQVLRLETHTKYHIFHTKYAFFHTKYALFHTKYAISRAGMRSDPTGKHMPEMLRGF